MAAKSRVASYWRGYLKWSCIYFKNFPSWNKSIESRESTNSTFHTWHQTHKRPEGVPITCGGSIADWNMKKVMRFWEATLFALKAEIIFFISQLKRPTTHGSGCVWKFKELSIYYIHFKFSAHCICGIFPLLVWRLMADKKKDLRNK